ncbi:hypothetical protein ACHHYP_04119 [Achlya hypogyna]|uniref:J domain-containing protein n=1 Tax=Achlya hypogyna TaxID=1202772 RepID=A0A1V9Z202_ACHHY|nr:hypothetical protein ACHHYP_04119 [Achlya hypogyna]
MAPNLTSDDYYENLGVSRSATDAEIKAAYRKLAIKYHPDKNLLQRDDAEKKFKVVGEAYNILSDPTTRHTYDECGKAGLQDVSPPMTREMLLALFEDFFRFGDPMDDEAPNVGKGILRATGGIVYAPVKGVIYGGRSVLGGIVMGTAAVVIGLSGMAASFGMGVLEMSQAGVNAAKSNKRRRLARQAYSAASQRSNSHASMASVASAPAAPTASLGRAICDRVHILFAAAGEEHEDHVPTFLGGLKKATVGAVSIPVASLVTCGTIMVGGTALAGGYIVGGLAGAITNISSGFKEVKLANQKRLMIRRASMPTSLPSQQPRSTAGARRATVPAPTERRHVDVQ